MINHSTCDHPSTPSARSKCRRARAGGKTPPTERQSKASVKTIDDEDNYGQTPARRDMECHKCGVERIVYRGTDPLTGILLFVGERCRYYIKNADDLQEVQSNW